MERSGREPKRERGDDADARGFLLPLFLPLDRMKVIAFRATYRDVYDEPRRLHQPVLTETSGRKAERGERA